MLIEELESLARNHSAKVTITLNEDGVSASWKVPGNRTETVSSFRPCEGVTTVLQTLMERLGRFRSVPTNTALLERMSPKQKQRYAKLLTDLRALRHEVMNPTPLDVLEPFLASPRSSLNPDYFIGLATENEVVDRGLAGDAKRAAYQAKEHK